MKTNPPTEGDFYSRAALGVPEPARADLETSRLHAGISVRDTEKGARDSALRYRRQGRFIAALETPQAGVVQFERTGQAGHVTMWGDPATLLAMVIFVVDV